MKLKQYIVPIVALLSSVSASADIVRIYFTDPTSVPEDSVEFSDLTSLSTVRHISHEYDSILGRERVHIGTGSKVCRNIQAYSWVANMNTRGGIKFLRPEKVKFEIEDHDIFPVANSDYEIIFNGKVSLVDDSDDVIEGVLETESYIDTPMGPFRCESKSVTFPDENHSRMNYKLGGEFGREIKFELVASARNLTSGRNRVYNKTDANSFVDFKVIQTYTLGILLREMGNKTIMNISSDMAKVSGHEIPFTVNQFLCHYGAKATFKIQDDSFFVNGKSIPLSQYSNYIKSDFIMNINEETHPYCYLPYEFDISQLDITKSNTLSFSLVLDTIELSPETPELVRKAVEHVTQEPINQEIQTVYVRNEADRLTIDPAKVSFPDIEEYEGSIDALFDDNPNTFCHSSWSIAKPRSEPYGSYMDIELEEPIQELGFAMQTRASGSVVSYPKNIRLYWSNDGETWNLLAEPEVSGKYVQSEWIDEFNNHNDRFKASEPFKYLRFCVIANSNDHSLTQTSTFNYWNLAELHFYGK